MNETESGKNLEMLIREQKCWKLIRILTGNREILEERKRKSFRRVSIELRILYYYLASIPKAKAKETGNAFLSDVVDETLSRALSYFRKWKKIPSFYGRRFMTAQCDSREGNGRNNKAIEVSIERRCITIRGGGAARFTIHTRIFRQ